MKTRTKIFTALLILLLPATFLGIWYFQSHPQMLDTLTSKLGISKLEREERVDVPEEKALTVDYVFPYEYYEEGMDVYGGGELDEIWPFSYFKSVGGDLWLRWENERSSEGGFICNEGGTIKEISPEEVSAVPETGEVRVAETAFADLPEGSYYVCLRPDGEFFYMAYYVEVYDKGDFTPDVFYMTTRDKITETLGYAPYQVFYADDPKDLTFHFNNLGENTFNQVFFIKTDITGENPHNVNMPDGSYEISDNGNTVTIKADYLAGLSKNQAYQFALGRKDGSDFVLNGEADDAPEILVMSSRSIDFPYVEGPEVYSLSSGEECVITLHMGTAESVYSSEYWNVQPGDEFFEVASFAEMETGQFTIPREAMEYFKEHSEYGNMGFSVCFRFNEALYLSCGIQIQLTD